MSVFAIGDLHLPGHEQKPMDVFGGRWAGYTEKLREGLSVLRPEDTLVIPGDFCWSLDLESAAPDFEFLESFPGRKLLVKGNHDYWWTTLNSMRTFLKENDFTSIDFLYNQYQHIVY